MKALFSAIANVLKEYATDAKGRPEIKIPLAILAFALAAADIWIFHDFPTFVALLTSGLALLGMTTFGDSAIDKGAGK